MAADASPFAQSTLDQYWVAEEASNTRNEYQDGVLYAMPDETMQHAWITGNVFGILQNRLKDRPCRVAASQMKVFASRIQSVMYPDVLVACEPIQMAGTIGHATIANPTAIIEVLSTSTERRDRGWKFKA